MTSDARRMAAFKRMIWRHYAEHGRHGLPWRRDTSPYAIAVSEVMLQQTQVKRVIPKFEAWMKRFPGWRALAEAPTKDILQEWSGLGYNRRALYLKRIAEAVADSPTAELPHTYEGLRKLPGIGPNTAGSILAFAFNEPRAFIETNVRSVFIHHFFHDTERTIADAELMPLIEQALDRDRPREWYWALMDHGSHIKAGERSAKHGARSGQRSAHYARQSPFKGSNREARSLILRAIMAGPATAASVAKRLQGIPADRVRACLDSLVRDGFAEKAGKLYRIV